MTYSEYIDFPHNEDDRGETIEILDNPEDPSQVEAVKEGQILAWIFVGMGVLPFITGMIFTLISKAKNEQPRRKGPDEPAPM